MKEMAKHDYPPRENSRRYRMFKTWMHVAVLVIVLLPLLANAQVLIFGNRARGEVIAVRTGTSNSKRGNGIYTYARISFQVGNEEVEVNGPRNVRYKKGEQVTVIYDPNDPAKYLIANFSGIYFSISGAVSAILLIFWYAAYHTIRREHALRRVREQQDPVN